MLYFFVTLTICLTKIGDQKMEKKNLGTQVQLSEQLPDGLSDGRYLKSEEEWPNLRKRLGVPRIFQHIYFPRVLQSLEKMRNSDDFFYFDAGCGHGNDLRAIRRLLRGRGHFLGVTMSLAEISQGLSFYHQRDEEDTEKARQFFGQGDLHNLRQVMAWNEEEKNFSYPKGIENDEMDLIYMEAVLQASGYGHKTYQEKKDSAQQILNELFRICKPSGKFFGRVSAFHPIVCQERRFAILRKYDTWRFIPGFDEFSFMLKTAGFTVIERTIDPHEKAAIDPSKEDMIKISFLAEKI